MLNHTTLLAALTSAIVVVTTGCDPSPTADNRVPPWSNKTEVEGPVAGDDDDTPGGDDDDDDDDDDDAPGDNGPGDGTGDELAPPADPPPPLTETGTPTAPLRRLTEEELNHTLRDLFTGIAVPHVTAQDGEDASNRGGFEGDVTRQTPSDFAVDQLRVGALAVAAEVVLHKSQLLPRVPSSDVNDERNAGHEFLAVFGPRALRRPLDSRELGVYGGLFDAAFDDAGFDVALQIVIGAFLQAPAFLYRVEVGDESSATDDEAVALTSYEMASRLSYLLWTSMPDEQLFDAAAADALRDPDDIEAQARRMLDDPRAKDAVLSFHRQWLDFDRVLTQQRDPATYPQWSDSLVAAMRTEADEMVEHAIFEDDGKLRTLLTTHTTRVNGPLANLYGVPAPTHDWDLVELPGAQRAGVLTQAAFLATRAHAVNPSPVLRGVFILDRFLCMPPPPPASVVNTTPPESDPNIATTNRQRYAQHTFDTVCQDCHAGIDGIGMGLENYDAIGAYRTTDNGFPVDASGSLDAVGEGGSFEGGPALAQLLADSTTVEECVARQWLAWSKGRAEDQIDWPHIDEIASRFHANDGDVRELLVAIATSPTFRLLPKVSP